MGWVIAFTIVVILIFLAPVLSSYFDYRQANKVSACIHSYRLTDVGYAEYRGHLSTYYYRCSACKKQVSVSETNRAEFEREFMTEWWEK